MFHFDATSRTNYTTIHIHPPRFARLLRDAHFLERMMTITSKIGALFFKQHQSEAKRAKKKKRSLVLAMPTPRLARVQNGPSISQHIALDLPAPPRPLLVPRFEAVPDDLPTVTAPPPGTAALEEADTGEGIWVDGDSGVSSSPAWCRSCCCSPCE